MRFVFDERKAAEVAAHFLEKAGGRMPYIKLLKLVYLADRQSLIETGFPITGDLLVSMNFGPVPSRIYDNINHGPREGTPSPWFLLISPPESYDVSLLGPPPPREESRLSAYELGVIDAVFERFGHLKKWDLVDLLHKTLPEWTNPQGTSITIPPEEILRVAGKTAGEVEQYVEEAEAMWFADSLAASG